MAHGPEFARSEDVSGTSRRTGVFDLCVDHRWNRSTELVSQSGTVGWSGPRALVTCSV